MRDNDNDVLRGAHPGQQLHVVGVYLKGESSAKLHIMCLFTYMDAPESRLSVIEPQLHQRNDGFVPLV